MRALCGVVAALAMSGCSLFVSFDRDRIVDDSGVIDSAVDSGIDTGMIDTGVDGGPRCAVDERVVGGLCEACPAGSTNAAGDDPAGGDTFCDATLCAEDEHVVSNECVACPSGSTNLPGDDATDADTPCDATACPSNEHVVSNACVPCPAGTDNEAGDDATGADTSCDPILCLENERVMSNMCVACASGTVNPAGDDASGPDTMCTSGLCGMDEYVMSGMCTPCAPGFTNPAGDDPTMGDTSCTPLLCAMDQRVMSNACVPCAVGFTNPAGDDASGPDTSCAPICGDAMVLGGEVCDDGNADACGTCSDDCGATQPITPASAMITFARASDLVDGDNFTIDDGTMSATFEYDTAIDGVMPGNVAVDLSGTTTRMQVRARTVLAIATTTLTFTATDVGSTQTLLTNTSPGAAGNTATVNNVATSVFAIDAMFSGGMGLACPTGTGCVAAADCASLVCDVGVCQ